MENRNEYQVFCCSQAFRINKVIKMVIKNYELSKKTTMGEYELYKFRHENEIEILKDDLISIFTKYIKKYESKLKKKYKYKSELKIENNIMFYNFTIF